MDHSAHEPGTVEECPECRALAYEPGWYKALREERPAGIQPILIPDAEEIEVTIPEAADLEVVLPDLEDVRPEDEER